MTVILALDISLAVLVLAVAAWTIVSREVTTLKGHFVERNVDFAISAKASLGDFPEVEVFGAQLGGVKVSAAKLVGDLDFRSTGDSATRGVIGKAMDGPQAVEPTAHRFG